MNDLTVVPPGFGRPKGQPGKIIRLPGRVVQAFSDYAINMHARIKFFLCDRATHAGNRDAHPVTYDLMR